MLATLALIALGASLVPAHRAARSSPALLTALITTEAIGLVLVGVAVVSARTWSSIAQEDGVIEWATFLAYVFAAGWLLLVVRKQSPSWWFKGATFLLAAFCIVVAGEEISWGQRLFGFKPPDVFLERNFQQEMNLHNVLMDERGLGFKLESKDLVVVVVLGFCAVWPWLVRRRRFTVFGPLAPPYALLPLALGVAAAELAYNVELTGEGAELVAGLIFLASALVVAQPPPRVVMTWLLAPLVVGLLLSTILARVMFGSDEDGTRTAAAELALLSQDVANGATDKLLKKNVHKRAFTSMHDGYVTLAGGTFYEGQAKRHDRRGYCLDPWNNPYWIFYDKSSRTGAVYSFGPNRRRDIVVRDPKSDPGDDVIVRFRIPETAAAAPPEQPAQPDDPTPPQP
ncbi:MAG TPA: hypothetical protein VFV99_30200 [Kofleriaceae bacterium]|nr:hypothetical protein [Kofleriaceae bacterium]